MLFYAITIIIVILFRFASLRTSIFCEKMSLKSGSDFVVSIDEFLGGLLHCTWPCSGHTSGFVPAITPDGAGDWTRASHKQGRYLNLCVISLASDLLFYRCSKIVFQSSSMGFDLFILSYFVWGGGGGFQYSNPWLW